MNYDSSERHLKLIVLEDDVQGLGDRDNLIYVVDKELESLDNVILSLLNIEVPDFLSLDEAVEINTTKITQNYNLLTKQKLIDDFQRIINML